MSEHGQPERAAAGESEIFGGTVNSGVTFNGGTISGGVIAGGQGSNITVSQGGAADDRMAQIEQLIQQLQAAASKLNGEQAEQVQDDAVRLAGEVKQRKPDSRADRPLDGPHLAGRGAVRIPGRHRCPAEGPDLSQLRSWPGPSSFIQWRRRHREC